MNVWKYIYIKFFKIRRRIIGRDGADEYAAMLFVASFDVLLYFGILILIDKSVDKVLSKEYEPLYFAFYMLGMLTIERLRNRTMPFAHSKLTTKKAIHPTITIGR